MKMNGLTGELSLFIILLFLIAGTSVSAADIVLPPDGRTSASPDTSGDRVIVHADDSNVTVIYRGTDADLASEFGLFSPTKMILGKGHVTPINTTFDIGTFPTGTELIFYINNSYSGQFLSGPGDRNPDGVVHAAFSRIGDQEWNIGWEDLWGGGDRDYNDIEFSVEGDLLVIGPDETFPIIADFTSNVTSGYPPLVVQFEDDSFGPVDSWSWDFGDGQQSARENPAHTYTQPGDYTVSLTIGNVMGQNDAKVIPNYIHVSQLPPPPVARFSATPVIGPAPLTVKFSDLSLNSPVSWSWDFGDGQNSTTKNPAHNYTQPGDYSVSLTVKDNLGQSDTKVMQSYIHVRQPAPALPPVAKFSATPVIGPAPLTAAFTDLSLNSPVSWLWNFGDGQNSTMKNPTHNFTQPGDFTVSLTVKDGIGRSNTKVMQNYIHVQSTPIPAPVAKFSATLVIGPAPLTVVFTDLSLNSPVSWLWSFGDGQRSVLKNPTHNYTQPGSYTVSLTVRDNQGRSNTKVLQDYIHVRSG